MYRSQLIRAPSLILAILGTTAFIYLAILPRPFGIDGLNILNGAQRLAMGQNPYDGPFFYPAWLAAALLPLTVLAEGVRFPIWSLFTLAVNLLTAVGLARYVRVPTWRAVAFTLIFPPAGWVVTGGQVDGLLMMALISYLWMVRTGRLGLAGAFLAVLLTKPQLGLFVGSIILVFHVVRSEWAVLKGWVTMTGALSTLAFLVWPTWLTDWLVAVTRYDAAERAVMALGVPRAAPGFLVPVTLMLAFSLAAWVLWRRPDTPPLVVTSGAVVGTVVLTPVSHFYDLSLLLIPMMAVMPTRHGGSIAAAMCVWPAMVNLAGWRDPWLLPGILVILTAAVAFQILGRECAVRYLSEHQPQE